MTSRILLLLIAAAACSSQQRRNTDDQPAQVDPGAPGKAPSDAVPLFDGASLDGWTGRDGNRTGCAVEEGEMVCRSGSRDIMTRRLHGAAQIHVEFKLPSMLDQEGQLRANSGVYLQGRYEIQVLDSLNNPTYPNGSAGAVYGQHVPLVNPSLGPGKWQTYDIVFHPPVCDGTGRVVNPGSITLLFNGVLVQDHVRISKSTGGAVSENVCSDGPLLLQDHSGFPGAPQTELRFRNIWMRPLRERPIE
ncbi:MAG: DUF1080 domain-containing protein [Acidobacteria bacterium]|nr:DUF1080 domain-containing protein [Acidobacteriota bacterium]